MVSRVWQLSLVWAGKVVAVGQQHGPPGQHPFLALVGATRHPVPAAPPDGYRILARQQPLAVVIESVPMARRSWWTPWQSHEATALVITALLCASLYALTFVPPSLAPVSDDESVRIQAPPDTCRYRDPNCDDEPWSQEPVVWRGSSRFRPPHASPIALPPFSPVPPSIFRFTFDSLRGPSAPPVLLGIEPHHDIRAPDMLQANDLALRDTFGLREVKRRDRPAGPPLEWATWHVVRSGETLGKIAARYDFASYLDLYNERLNPELLALRPDPHRIFPGDRVRIPYGRRQ